MLLLSEVHGANPPHTLRTFNVLESVINEEALFRVLDPCLVHSLTRQTRQTTMWQMEKEETYPVKEGRIRLADDIVLCIIAKQDAFELVTYIQGL